MALGTLRTVGLRVTRCTFVRVKYHMYCTVRVHVHTVLVVPSKVLSYESTKVQRTFSSLTL